MTKVKIIDFILIFIGLTVINYCMFLLMTFELNPLVWPPIVQMLSCIGVICTVVLTIEEVERIYG